MDRTELRRVRYSGHQESWGGWFHGWTVIDGERVAVIERDSGRLAYERGIHCLRFVDPLPAPEDNG